jgi:hypothetical protein
MGRLASGQTTTTNSNPGATAWPLYSLSGLSSDRSWSEEFASSTKLCQAFSHDPRLTSYDGSDNNYADWEQEEDHLQETGIQ